MAFMSIGLGSLMLFVTIAETVFALFYIIKRNIAFDKYEFDLFKVTVSTTFLFILIFLSTITVSFVNSLPNETTNGVGYYQDWLFWAGNNIAFTKGFPTDNFRQIGEIFKYHYFSSILMANISICTGVDINLISFYFSNIFSSLILVFSSFFFITRLVSDRWIIVMGMVAILFSGSESYLWHISICPFGFDYGLSYGMMSLAFLTEMVRGKRYNNLIVPTCIFLALTTGFKGPVGVVVLVSFAVVSFYFFTRREIKKAIFSGLVWLGLFLTVYQLFINDKWTKEAQSGLQYIGGLGIDTIITSNLWTNRIYEEILSNYRITFDKLIVKLYAVWLNVFMLSQVAIVLFFISIMVIIFDLRRGKHDVVLYMFSSAVLVGILFLIYTFQGGYSQMYFMLSAIPIAIGCGGYSLERILENQKKSGNLNVFKFLSIVVLITLGLSINDYYDALLPKLREGMITVRDKGTSLDYTDYFADTVDYEAFSWLKDNTSTDCVFAIDSHFDTYGRANDMVAGVFSQRYVWNENKYVFNHTESERRNEIVNSLSDDVDKAIDSMKSEGVDYLVSQITDENGEYGEKTKLLKEVFRNAHYIIYEL